MKKYLVLPLVFALFGCSGIEVKTNVAPADFPTSLNEERYFLHTGDILTVKVYSGDLLDSEQELVVLPDGTIQPTLLDVKITAGGSDVETIREILVKEYDKIIKNVRVDVIPKTLVQRYVIVAGEVETPMQVVYPGRTLTILGAIASAGWLTYEGDATNVTIIRPKGNGEKPMVTTVDLDTIKDNTNPENDIILLADDMVVVHQSGISQINKIVDQYMRKMLPDNGNGLGYLYGIGLVGGN